jgi:uncharacterized protein DUF1835
MAELIITNGDSAADLLAAAGKAGRILPWRDVLHEGPILADLSACTRARVAYLAGRFLLDKADVAAEFAARDAILAAHAEFDRIELWFEHDLFDQLQLLQILSFFAEAGRQEGIILVQADDFLGRQRADTVLRFAGKARPVGSDDLRLAEEAWRAVAAPTPEAVVEWLANGNDRLPYLRPALRRFLEELPAPGTGLGRTQATALTELAETSCTAVDLFRAVLATEEAAFMGDLSFFGLVEDLAFEPVRLIDGLPPPVEEDIERFQKAVLELSMAGDDVLNGEADHIALNGIQRWWGGTFLDASELDPAVWRYDRERRRLLPPSAD